MSANDMRLQAYFEELLIAEGGFVDHPTDPGGATKYGISHRLLNDMFVARNSTYTFLFGRSAPTKQMVKDLTPSMAKEIFKAMFYRPLKLESFSFDVGLMLCDYAYNAGARQAVKDLQRAFNDASARLFFERGLQNADTTERPSALMVDGYIGPRTIAAIGYLIDTYGDDYILDHFNRRRVQFYKKLAQRKPELTVFLKGWLNRAIVKDTPDLPKHLEGNTNHDRLLPQEVEYIKAQIAA